MRLAIFDLDGTLLDSRADLAASVNAMRAGYGLPPLDLDTVTGYVGNGLRKLVLRSLQGHPADTDEAIAHCSAYYGEHLHDASALYPGVHEGLEALSAAGWSVALCSNKPEAWCRSLLEHFGLADRFAHIAGGDSFPRMKPEPEPILGIMKACGPTSPEATWLVGDSATDVGAAKAAGVGSVFVTYGYHSPGDFAPDHEANSLPDAVALLLATDSGGEPCPGAQPSATLHP